MSKRVISGIMLTLLLISILTLKIDVQLVTAADGTIYIRANGRIEPPTAPISTFDNVTYTFTGDIYKPIVVERSNILINGDGYMVQGTVSGKSFSLYSISNVTIKDTYITRFYSGIYLSSSSNCSISGNTITLNNNGIEFTDSSNNTVSGNTITSNNGAGILLIHSLNNSLRGNSITSNYSGIYLSSSSNCSIIGNDITTSNYSGIYLSSSSNCSISGNTITSNNNGIGLSDSSSNTLVDNAMAYNKYNFDVWGLTFTHFVNDIDVSNTVDDKPVYYWINETDSAVPLDAGYVALVNCTRIIVQDLNLTKNEEGILLAYTADSTITRNKIANNYFGMRLRDSSNNSIYHNNFINNTNQVSTYDSVNVWDDGYPSGGNYWSDHYNVDWYRGPYQNVTGSDGIGDIKYFINAGNIDNYPLIKPYAGLHDIGITNIAKSETVVGQGYNVTITLKIVNYGLYTETFNLTVYANATTIQTIANLVLTSRNSTTLTFIWNTTGFTKGNYTISAIADTVPDETDTSDNMFVDGWVFILSSEHDVAIRSFSSNPNVGEGYTSPINVTAMNVGSYTETFNVTAYIDAIPITSQNTTLESGASATLTFIWNTTGFAKGNYTISAIAAAVLGEIDTTDNNRTNGWILITKLGDLGGSVKYAPTFFACDGVVDGYDLALFIQCYKGLAPSEAMYLGDLGAPVMYVPTFFACDGVVDGYDLALFIQCYKGQGP